MNDQSLSRRSDGFFERGQQVTRLEAFVDAAFAFAVTLLAISIDSIPGTREELLLAMKGIPAFFASFAVLALFWWEHTVWSRHYGLDDGTSTLLSLLFVGTLLVYVYPLKILFAAMFAWASGGWLPASYQITTVDDLLFMYRAYAGAFALLGILMLALRWHAWRCRVQIQLDPLECLLTRRHMLRSAMLPLFALLSLLLTLPLDRHSPGWALALPGFVYFGLFAQFLAMRLGRREEQSLRADAALAGRV